jgi:ankyrin repeat protein
VAGLRGLAVRPGCGSVTNGNFVRCAAAAILAVMAFDGRTETAEACPVWWVSVIPIFARSLQAVPAAGPAHAEPQTANRAKVVHHRPAHRNVIAQLRSQPDSDAYRARYDGPQGLAYSILDPIGMDDPAAFRAAVEKALPDPAHRQRKDFLRLHIDPLSNAFDRGDRAVVELLLQWDPGALTDSNPPFPRDEAFERVLAHWRYATGEDFAEHQDDDPPTPPDPRIAADHAHLVRLLLAAGARPNAFGGALGTDELAALAGNPASPEVSAVVEELLRHGLSINSDRPGRMAPFALAAKARNTPLIDLMIKYQRPDQQSLDQALLATPMLQENGLIEFLLERGANINSAVDVGYAVDPLAEAARRWRDFHEEGLIRLLIRYKADPNRTAAGAGDSALTLVLADPDIALAVLALGANVNWHDAQGDTPLHRVAQTRLNRVVMSLAPAARAHLIDALLARGADANAQNAEGLTPLMLLDGRQADSIDRLLRAGAALHLTDRDLSTPEVDPATQKRVPFRFGPITWALLHGNAPLARGLLARTDHLAHEDCGAIFLAMDDPQALAMLLEKGVETKIMLKNGQEETPLMFAAEGGYAESVKLLLDRRLADIEQTTPSRQLSAREIVGFTATYGYSPLALGGKTALIFAVEGLHAEAVEELLRHGANPNHADAGGHRPLTYARANVRSQRPGAQEIERILLARGANE